MASRLAFLCVILILAWLGSGTGLAADWKDLQADGRTNAIPVHWDQVSPKSHPPL